jgi:hypothetical protein
MGAMHGCVIVLERLFASYGYNWPKSKVFNLMRIIRTHIFINISGVLFLSPTMSVAIDIYNQIFNYEAFINQSTSIFQLHGYSFFLILIGGLIVTMVADKLKNRILIINRLSACYRYGLLYIIFFVAIAFAERTSDEFFYFIF